MLLLGPILFDTVNLNPQRHRVTPKDEVVAKKLLTIAQINQNVFFEELQTAKFNDESLTTWGMYSCPVSQNPLLSFFIISLTQPLAFTLFHCVCINSQTH